MDRCLAEKHGRFEAATQGMQKRRHQQKRKEVEESPSVLRGQLSSGEVGQRGK